MSESPNAWSKCSICKKPINFKSKYFLCSVSTCKNPRTGPKFCSATCWDVHLGDARHREAWAEETIAPKEEPFSNIQQPTATVEESSKTPVRRFIETPKQTLKIDTKNLETLVVVSKVKQLIKDHSEFNTSQCCIDALTEKVAEIALNAIESAKKANRKTVMGRDV